MASALDLKGPFTLASLPRPIDNSAGQYRSAEVYGGRPGDRKRKRAELAVGIDGEGLNIYDTNHPRLITSYALPPQSSFTCDPYSLRWKDTAKRQIERRSYVSVNDSIPQIVLFQDSVKRDGTTESTQKIHKLGNSSSPVVFLGVAPGQQGTTKDSLIIVKQDGEIECLDSDQLEPKWTSPASTISTNTDLSHIPHHTVEFAQLTDTFSASKGLLKAHADIFTAFPESISRDGFNPSLLILISSPRDASVSSSRTLHVIALPQGSEKDLTGRIRAVQSLIAVPVSWHHRKDRGLLGDITYDVHASSGTLYELAESNLFIHDLTSSVPKLKYQLLSEEATSFLRLTDAALLTASAQNLSVLNPIYHSLQARLALDDDDKNSNSRKSKSKKQTLKSVNLVSYSSKQELVYGICGNELVGFQLETSNGKSHNNHKLGLLIDSLGSGLPRPREKLEQDPEKLGLQSFGDYIPGAVTGREAVRRKKIAELDRCASAQDVESFEGLLAQELGISRDESELQRWKEAKDSKQSLPNGEGSQGQENGLDHSSEAIHDDMFIEEKPVPSWLWPDRRENYPEYDSRWAHYALSKIFVLTTPDSETEAGGPGVGNQTKLLIAFFPHNVVNWLIETGNMNKANIESALKNDLPGIRRKALPPGHLVKALAEVDPEMRLLFSLLSNTFLDASELVHSIKLLMQSLELFGEGVFEEPLLLTNGEAGGLSDDDVEAQIEIGEEEADAALQLAEFHLSDESGIRVQTLSLALAKLHACPPSAVVSALQLVLTSNEIVSLIYLLRFELARGAWTSRYLDTNQIEGHGDDSAEESPIIIITSLLNNCIDAVGSGGWLSGDTVPINGDHFESEELITSLKLEVSAALEGIEEATYLGGLVDEMLNYEQSVAESGFASVPSKVEASGERKRKRETARPLIVPSEDKLGSLLPLGLKVEKPVSLLKVNASGEIYRRTRRDIGRLKSHKVGKYSLERIVI